MRFAPRWRFVRVILLAGGIFLLGCGIPRREPPPPERVTLKVPLLPYVAYSPLFIAEEEGYFAEEGVEIEFVKFDRSDEAIPAVAQGQLDVLAGSPKVGLFNALYRGSQIKLVADAGHMAARGCTTNALMARRDLVEAGQLDHPGQLRGRRIVLNPASSNEYYLDKLLRSAGLALGDVEMMALPNPAKLDALRNGSVDLVDVGEPWLTRISRDGQAVIWVPAKQVIPDYQMSFIAYGPNLLEQNPEIGQRFMIAYLKGVRQYRQGKTERNLEIISEYTGLDRDLLIEACWAPIRDDGQINVKSVLDFEAWAVEKGYIYSLVPEDQFWDPSFADYANEVLGAPSE
jgi:NitT/TauT family transport system substrate-binding protein